MYSARNPGCRPEGGPRDVVSFFAHSVTIWLGVAAILTGMWSTYAIAAGGEENTAAVSPPQEHTLLAGDLYALVVGVSKYSNPGIPGLKLAAKDARDFAEFLQKQKKVFRNIHLKLLLDEKATRTEIEKFIFYDVLRAGKDDSVIMFFSGHGSIDPRRGGEFFFVTHDADPDYLGATSILMSGLRFLNKVEANRVLLIADACHAGGFSASHTKSLAQSIQSFLEEFRESSGRVIITSSKPDEYSLELPHLGNGAFTHFLLEGVKGKADTDKNGVVTVQEAYEYVYEMTKNQTNGAQHPSFEGNLTGSFPISFLHPPAPMLEIVTRPPRTELYIREGSRFTFLTKTDDKGLAKINKLPLGKAIIMMAKKAGWKEKILDPFSFSPEKMTIKMPPVVLDKSLGFLVVRTNASRAAVNIEGAHAGTTGKDGMLILDGVQVGVSHEVKLTAQGYESRKFRVRIPSSYEGRVYKTAVLELRQKPKKTSSTSTRKPATENKTPPAPDRAALERAKAAETAKLQQSKLLEAVKGGKLADVKTLLAKKIDLNTRDHLGWTPLMHAVSSNSQHIAEFLLSKGANSNLGDNLGWTPLMVAASSGNDEMVKLLLANGAHKSASNVYGETAASKAAAAGHDAVLVLLGVRPTKVEASGKKPESHPERPDATPAEPKQHPVVVKRHETRLFKAAKKGDTGEVKKLLAEGVNVNATDELDWTPLMYAAAGGHLSVAKLLVDKFCQVNARDRFGWTPLMLAATNGHPSVVRFLLDKGADRDARNVYGETAGMKAKLTGNQEVLQLLGVSPIPSGTVTRRERRPEPRSNSARESRKRGPSDKTSEETDWIEPLPEDPEIKFETIPQIDRLRGGRGHY